MPEGRIYWNGTRWVPRKWPFSNFATCLGIGCLSLIVLGLAGMVVGAIGNAVK